MIFIIGAQGRLGGRLLNFYRNQKPIALQRLTYQDWWRNGSHHEIKSYFSQWQNSENVVFVAAGLLDQEKSAQDHMKINYWLPKNIIDASLCANMKVVTFGSIMECLPQMSNAYVDSKRMLGNEVASLASYNNAVLHLQLHTLYGVGQPKPYSFLGQLYQAVISHQAFQMTSGNQLREYHHVDDDIAAIYTMLEAKCSGVMDVSHGRPMRLREIALRVYQSFHDEANLLLGAIPEPGVDNFHQVFTPNQLLHHVNFRDTLEGITGYFFEWLQTNEIIHE